jgi:hypothetical protein
MVKAHCILLILTVAWMSNAGEKYDLFDLAHDVAKKELGTEWPKFVAKVKGRFDDRVKQDGVSLNTFLNDTIHDIGAATKKGDIESLKKLVNWIALYKEWANEEGGLAPPEWLRDTAFENSGEVERLKGDFSWDKLKATILEKVKEKEAKKK